MPKRPLNEFVEDVDELDEILYDYNNSHPDLDETISFNDFFNQTLNI